MTTDTWQTSTTPALAQMSVDVDAVFAHLALAKHIKQPATTWRKKLPALLPSGALAVLLRPFTPAGKRRPTSADGAVFGAIWAAPDLATPELLDLVVDLVPWCQKEFGTSHQAAAVGVMALGVWPTRTVDVLERFRDAATLASLIATTRASLRKQNEAHPE